MQTTANWKLLTIFAVTTEKQLDRTKKCCYLARKTATKEKIVHSCLIYHWQYKQNTAIWISLTPSIWLRRHSFVAIFKGYEQKAHTAEPRYQIHFKFSRWTPKSEEQIDESLNLSRETIKKQVKGTATG